MNEFRLLLFLLLFSLELLAQNKDKSKIGIQEVVIVKSYSPSLNEVFKIKTNPRVPDSVYTSKKNVSYKILNVPVISTFQPNKASPLKLKQRKPSSAFNTIFSGAYGNKNQLFLNVSNVTEIDRNQRFGIRFYKDGFSNNINNTLLKSNQNYSDFGLNHNLRSSDYNVNTHFKFTSNINNYYGLSGNSLDTFFLRNINPEIRRNNLKIRTHWNWYNFFLRSFEFQANITSDNFNTVEQQIALKNNFDFDLGAGKLKGELKLFGFNTNFESSYYEKNILEFTQGLGAFDLLWQLYKNNFKIKIGAGASYILGVEKISNNLVYYPQVEFLYEKPGNILLPYLKGNGGVTLNTYSSLTKENPYLAPTSNLIPSFSKYNLNIGIRSRLASVLNFDMGFIFDEIENFNFFERLPFDNENNLISYRLSNSFQSNYLDANLYGFRASIRIDLIKDNFVFFETRYNYYETQKKQILWNIPSLEMNWESQIKLRDFIALSFYGSLWGVRDSSSRPIFFEQSLVDAQAIPPDVDTLPLFFRTSTHISFKITEQFDLFIKARFNSSGIHGRWAYYPEAPLLILGGLTYKFDFQY